MYDRQRQRYLRHILLKEVGAQGQQKLLDARVLVVGAGGIGAPLLQYLAAAGVGTLGIADDDEVALSNLQRQVIYTVDDLGQAKTASARAAIGRLNPDVRVVEHCTKLRDDNAREIIREYDLVVEGVDNFDSRFAVNRAAIAAEKPLISAAVGRFEGQLATFKPFAAPGLPCYRCLVPEIPPREAQVNCAEVGVLGSVTGVIGALATTEVLKELLGVGDSLAGRLLYYDGLKTQCRTIALPADPQCPECGTIRRKS